MKRYLHTLDVPFPFRFYAEYKVGILDVIAYEYKVLDSLAVKAVLRFCRTPGNDALSSRAKLRGHADAEISRPDAFANQLPAGEVETEELKLADTLLEASLEGGLWGAFRPE